MTVHLPPGLESSIRNVVHSGRYASIDDAMAEAASLLLERLERESVQPPAAAHQPESVSTHKPIWEVVDDLRKSIPPEEFAKLPKDGAEQLDHYLYS